MTEPAAIWPLPYLTPRHLPADTSDQRVVDESDAMTQELRALGVPEDLIRVNLTPLDDGSWVLRAWQAKDEYSREKPPFNPQDYSFPATN